MDQFDFLTEIEIRFGHALPITRDFCVEVNAVDSDDIPATLQALGVQTARALARIEVEFEVLRKRLP